MSASCDVTNWPDALTYVAFFAMIVAIVWIIRRSR